MPHSRSVFFLTLTILGFFTITVRSQSVLKIPFNKKLGPDNGLSSYNASRVLQDKYGFAWIATQDGLNRYDGRKIIVYSKSSIAAHRLLGNVINEIMEDTARNMLWVTTSYGGLNGIDIVTGNVVHTLRGTISSSGFKNDWLKCMDVCDGRIWIGTYDGLYSYDPRTEKLTVIPGLKDVGGGRLNVNMIYTDKHGCIWVLFPDHGLAVFDTNGALLHFLTKQEMKLDEVQSYLQYKGRLAVINDTSFLLATHHGFIRIDHNRDLSKVTAERKLPINDHAGLLTIDACAIDHEGKVWYAASGQLYKADLVNGAYRRVKDISHNTSGNWLNSIGCIFFDPQHNLWLATQQGVTFTRNAPSPFIPYFEDPVSGIKIGHANYTFPLNDSILYIAAQDGLYKVNIATDELQQLYKGSRCDYIFRHEDGNMIVSGDNGLFVFRENKLTAIEHYYPELADISNESINSAVVQDAGVLALGSETNSGVHLWFTRERQLKSLSLKNDSFPNTIINKLYKDSRGQTWILFDNTIAILDPHNRIIKRWQPEDPDLKAPLSIFFDACEAGGYYWIAVYGKGVVQMTSNYTIRKIYSIKDGLLNTGVYKVFPYQDSLVFVTSNNGIYRIDTKEGTVLPYFKEDGLNTNNFEENCGYANEATFFAGGVEGVSVIRPELIEKNLTAPGLYLNHISIIGRERKDTFNLNWESLNIPNVSSQVTVSFSAINYSNPSRTIFAYRIKELNREWVQLGTQDFVDLIGLSPGKYTLEVKAANESNIWSSAKAITLHFLPEWHQTLGFKIALFISVLLILYGFYRIRLNQLRKQQEIRRNFASDLHDDIGSTLNSVKIFTHLALKNTRDKSHLLHIEELLQQAATGIRDMIWVLDDTQDNVAELFERIKKITLPVTLASGIAVEFSKEMNDERKLSKREKRNLLLLMKESVNNAIKHANCTNIKISCRLVNGKKQFVIYDNGQGFDVNSTSQGNGLRNMQERAQQAGYSFHINSGVNGTEIVLMER